MPKKVKTNTRFLLLVVFFALSGTAFCSGSPEKPPVVFIQNKGQVSDQSFHSRPDVLFSGQAGNMIFHLRNNGISYQLSQIHSWRSKEGILSAGKLKDSLPDKIGVFRVDASWINCNEHAVIQTADALPGYTNYYLAGCPNGVNNVLSFKAVIYKDIYPGVDIHYYGVEGFLKCDYEVSPGADYKKIQLRFEGAEFIRVGSDNSLEIGTPYGTILEDAPVVIQDGKILKVNWTITGNVVGFDIPHLDRSRKFIIDPLTRCWGSYYGGMNTEDAESVVTDTIGNVYITGTTYSGNGTSIATSGSHQTTLGGGWCDVYLAKFSSAGNRFWATYYGGADSESGTDCAVDLFNNVYVSGSSKSFNAISSTNGHQTSNGGAMDGFLAKFNSSGTRVWATYYGGQGTDLGLGCVSDGSQNVFLVGMTTSTETSVIADPGAHQPVFGGGSSDVFIVKFNSAGQRQWGSYYGGIGDEHGAGYHLRLPCMTDAQGNVYLTGTTIGSSAGVIATQGSHQPATGGSYDNFLVKFSPSGVRKWATFYGGAGQEELYGGSIDQGGNIYLSGRTTSISAGTSIATPGSHQSQTGGGEDAFLVKFDSLGTRLWGTYYGGAGEDCAMACCTDQAGNVYLAGQTPSLSAGSVISTPGSWQPSHAGGVEMDGFLVQFNGSGIRQWGSFYGGPGTVYGGPGEDEIRGCATDKNGNVFIVGYTSTTLGISIASPGSHQPFVAGTSDGFLAKFSSTALDLSITGKSSICKGEIVVLSTGGDFIWSNGTKASTISVSPVTNTFYTVSLTDSTGCIFTSGSAFYLAVEECISVPAMNGFPESLLQVFPNPTSDKIHIVCDKGDRLTIFNCLGVELSAVRCTDDKTEIDLSVFEKGIYFVQRSHSSRVETIKVIKQ